MASEYGFVYVLRNPSMSGCYKVGMTMRSPHQRAEEISKATGVPEAYEVVFYVEASNPSDLERDVHLELSNYRVNAGREFFRCPLDQILSAIEMNADFVSSWDSDIATEARNPGRVFPNNPLFFEASLYDTGYLLRFNQGGIA